MTENESGVCNEVEISKTNLKKNYEGSIYA